MGSLRLEFLIIEFCVGDNADAQEWDSILVTDKGSRGYFHILAGGVKGVVKVLDALLLAVPGVAACYAAIYYSAMSVCFRCCMGRLQ